MIAFIIGLETYQTRASGGLDTVQYARRDAEGFAEALRGIYGEDRLDIQLLVDNNATSGNIRYGLLQTIGSLEENDLFIFYYAGHGFHGAGGNRITAWDTHAHEPAGTSLLLRDILLDPLAQSACVRILAFVDACASGIPTNALGRDVVSDLSGNELKEFLTSASYCALFLSCEPGQKSYPSDEFRHGIWTHFLLLALRGEAESALGPGRFLTDVGLRDYLRQEVPAYITRNTQRRERQKPQAMITTSNTFAIREVPERQASIAEAGDLRGISLAPIEEFFEAQESGKIRTLPGFSKSRGHFEPDYINDRTTGFLHELIADQIDEEIQELYVSTKENFGLKRRDIVRESGNGEGSLDTEQFRYSIVTHQDSTDPKSYVIVRRLVLRGDVGEFRAEIDDTFGTMFERIVVKVSPDDLDYGELVDMFEDIEEAVGGDLTEAEHLDRITYRAPDGTKFVINVGSGRISLSGGNRQLVSALIDRAHQYRFNLSSPSQLLIA